MKREDENTGGSLSFFIDKECSTGYGPLTESLFRFYPESQSPCLESPSSAASGKYGAGRTVYLLETYLIYLSKGGIDNAEA